MRLLLLIVAILPFAPVATAVITATSSKQQQHQQQYHSVAFCRKKTTWNPPLTFSIRGGSSNTNSDQDWEEYDLEELGGDTQEEFEELEDIAGESENDEEENEEDMQDDEEDNSEDPDSEELETVAQSLGDDDDEDDEKKISEEVEDILSEESWEEVNDETVEEEEEEEELQSATTTADPFVTDDDSSAFVDREELADAYDEGESVVGNDQTGNSESEDRVSIDDVPPPDDLSPPTEDDSTKLEEQETETEAKVQKSLDPILPTVEVDPILPTVQVDPILPTVEVDPILPTVEVDPILPTAEVIPNLPLIDDVQEMETEADESVDPENAETVAMIPTIIDQATEDILIQQCKYTKAEVSKMKPDIAAVVAQKRLRRPLEGMPPNWIKEGVSTQTNYWNKETLIQMTKRIPKAVIPVSLAVLAIYGSLDVRNIIMASESQNQVIPEPKPEVNEEIVQDMAATEEDHLAEVIIESLKPGLTPKAPKDESWMDKVITCVANRFNAFWKLEI